MKTNKILYQWDAGQKLTDCRGVFVDFVISGEVYRCDVVNGECIVPDELLQHPGKQTAYECMADNTLQEFVFSVVPRPLPPDYVYTPTEKLTFEGLVQKVDDTVADIIRRADSGEFDGYTPVKGKDYFTESEKNEMMQRVSDGAIGEFREVVDSATAGFNKNSSAKTNDYNTNAEKKVGVYDSNAAEKLKAYNQNHTAKVAEYDANAETKTAEFDSNAAALQTEVDRLRGECDNLAAENRKQENRIDALIKLNKGQTYDVLEQESEAYSVDVPSGSRYVGVDKVGGKSVVWNQLIDLTYVNDIEINGITFTVNKGTITVNGTSTALARLYLKEVNYKINHKYLLKGCPYGGDIGSYFFYGDCGQSMLDLGDGVIMVAPKDNIHRPFINIESGATVDNIVFIPQLFDLTQIFGAGNEPSTVEEFEAMFPKSYYEYCEPTIISSQTDRVDVASADSTATQQITTGFPSLNSAGSAYDYIDLNEGKLHQRVGVVDLGTLTWETDASNRFRAQLSGIKNPTTANERQDGLVCARYSPSSSVSLTDMTDKGMLKYSGEIFIKDTAYTNATAFKESMNGVMLYYELAEEIITDIEIPTEFTDWLTVEAGGTVAFRNADESKQLAVPNAVSWVRKLDEVE